MIYKNTKTLIDFSQQKKIKILLLITGSIAAIRMPLLVSHLAKNNFEVKCVLTKNAEKIVQPLSLSILSRNNCILDDDQWLKRSHSPLHINLSEWADILIIAPLTATTLSKWVTGNADGLVSSILIANQKPLIVAPAMNNNMWLNAAVQDNFKKIKTYPNVLPITPNEGLLACDQFGIGKIPTNEDIILALQFLLIQDKNLNFQDLLNKSFLITGGCTVENIDLARSVTNSSSGEMGLCLAQIAQFRGAKVKFIHGPLKTNNYIGEGIEKMEITNSKELNIAIKNEIADYKYFFMNAAVTDIKMKDNISKKIPKNDLSKYFTENIELVPDILKEVCNHKKNNQIFVGFCAFSGSLDNMRPIIKSKINNKNCDLIFANPIDLVGQGFGYSAQNEGWLFDKGNMEFHIKKTSKLDLANQLINKIISIDK